MIRRHDSAGACLASSTMMTAFVKKSTDSWGQRTSTKSGLTPTDSSAAIACWQVSRVGASHPKREPGKRDEKCLMIEAAMRVFPHPAGAMMIPPSLMAHSTARCW